MGKIFQGIEEIIGHASKSLYTLEAYDDEKHIGGAKVLTDNEAWTLLYDVNVLPEYDEEGVAGKLIERVKNRFQGHEIFSYTDVDALSLYEEHGFKRSKNAFTYAGDNDEAINSGLLDKGFFLPIGYRYETEFYPVVGDFPKGKKSSIDRSKITMRYEYGTEHADYLRINEILSLAFGGHERDVKVTKRTFEESQHVVLAFANDILVGCARALSDGEKQGFILNVATDPEYQGLHIGMEVVRRLSEKMPGQNIFLNTHPGGVGFYNRRPFRRNKTALLFPSHPNMPPEIEKEFVLPTGYRFSDEF